MACTMTLDDEKETITLSGFVSTYRGFTTSDTADDTFAFFYEAFKNIDTKSGISNVIINLSLKVAFDVFSSKDE